MDEPHRISIVTPSFQQGRFIPECIESVLQQKDPNFEHIVMDGGSTDETVAVLQKYPHLIWRSEKDEGQSDAIRKAFEASTGDIIGWVNSDDFYYPDTFSEARRLFQAHPEADVVSGNYAFMDVSGKVLRVRKEIGFDYFTFLYTRKCSLSNAAIFFRRSVFERFGTPRKDLHYCMDYELYLRIGRHVKFIHSPQVFGACRMHSDCKTLAGSDRMEAESKAIQLEYLRKRPDHGSQERPSWMDSLFARGLMVRRILKKLLRGCYF